MQRAADGVGREQHDVGLHVRRLDRLIGAQEAPHIARPHREQTAAAQQIIRAGKKAAQLAREEIVRRHRLLRAEHQPRVIVILQIVPDTRYVGDHCDAVLAQECRGTKPRELHQLRRVERAARENDFAGTRLALRAALQVLDADRALAVENDARRERVRRDLEIAALARRFEITHRGRAAPPVARGELVIAEALLNSAIEIRIARIAALLGRFDESFGDRQVPEVGDAERPALAVKLIRAAALMLGLAEIRKHVRMAPADVAELAPAVVVLRLPAHIHQPVDRRRAAHHLAARRDDLAAVTLRLGLGFVEPVDLRVGEILAVAERHVDPDIAILAARLEQQHAMLAALGEAVRQHAARAAGAHDDEVERVHQAASGVAFALASARIMSEAFSPIITQAALVLPDTTVGMMDASATRRPWKPRTRRRSSTTAVTSEPMRQVEVGWNTVVPFWRANSR